MSGRRLPAGGDRIDRERPISFEFDGHPMTGFAGDTLASALLANGVDVVARSIYDDRPRGVMTAGHEEPNALVQVERADGVSEPMVRATTLPLEEGMRAWPLAGKGRLVDQRDDVRFDKRYAHVEALVIGAGASGMAAAADARAAEPDARVLVVDADPVAREGVLTDTTALGIYDHGYVTAVQRRPTARTEGRLWHIRAGRIVIATGATERPIVFADDDRPGIMLASAAATYVERYGVRPGDRAAVFTNNGTTDAVLDALRAAGTTIVAEVDARQGDRVVGTGGDEAGRLLSVAIAWADGRSETVEADLLLVSGGWNPNVALWSQARGTLRFDERIAAFVPDKPGPHGRMAAVGAAAGDIDGRSARSRRSGSSHRQATTPTRTPGRPTTSTSSGMRPRATCAGRSAPG